MDGLKYTGLDFIEEGRRNIFEWRETRRSKRSGLSGQFYAVTKLFLNRSILQSFINNLSIVVAFQMLLAGFCTYACAQLNLEFDVQMSLFVSPIVFPLAFSINANYQRRETVLEDLAMFKAASLVLFFCHRDWIDSIGLPTDLLKTLSNKLKFLVINIREYLLTEECQKRKFILQAVYEDFSDISQLNDKIRTSEMKSNSALVARLIHCHNLMCWSFERLRVIREYKSPRSLCAFTKVFIFFMPLLLSPYYVYRGTQTKSYWAPYYISALVSFLFGSLQAVQDKLDDPFDGIGEDDVNLAQLDEWTLQSLLTNRTVTVGRFTVTTTSGVAEDVCTRSGRTSPIRPSFSQQGETVVALHRVPSPKKKRRSSSTRKRDSTAGRPVLNDEQFMNELEARSHGLVSRLEGLSGDATILPVHRNVLLHEKQKLSNTSVSNNGATDEEKKATTQQRSVLPQGVSLEVVRESEEHCDVSTDTSPVLQRYHAKPPAENKPTIINFFGNDTDTVTSDESVECELMQTRTKPTILLTTPEYDSTADEYEATNCVMLKTECENRPSVMDLFGVNNLKSKSTSTVKKKADEEHSEHSSLLFKNNHTSDSASPPPPDGATGAQLHSPLASCEEDFSEDNPDDPIGSLSNLHHPNLPRRQSCPDPDTTTKSKPKVAFSSARWKKQPWTMPEKLSKWRKRRTRAKKKPIPQGVMRDGRPPDPTINTSTALLLSNIGGEGRSHDNVAESNVVSSDDARTSLNLADNLIETERNDLEEEPQATNSAQLLQTDRTLRSEASENVNNASSREKPKSRFAVTKT